MPYPTPRPAPANGPSTCPRCLAAVIWCTTSNRKPQMVDRGRNPDGNQAVRRDHTGRWLVRQLTNDRPTPEGAENLHMPHAATCTHPAPRQPRIPTTRGRQGVPAARRQR